MGCCGFLAAAGARALVGPGRWPHVAQTGIATPSCGPPGPEPLTRTGPGADGSALHLVDRAQGRAGPHVPTSTPGHLGAHIWGFRGSTPPGLWAGTGWRGRLQRPGSSQFPGATAALGLISSTASSQDVRCWLHLTLPAPVPRDGHGQGLGRWGPPSGFPTLILGSPGWQLCSRGLWDRRGRGITGQEAGTLGCR